VNIAAQAQKIKKKLAFTAVLLYLWNAPELKIN
jgi:hypothetical protein